MRSFGLAAALLVFAGSAEAQTMNAEAFHKRAMALQKKGPLAILETGEIKLLIGEGQAAANRSKQQRLVTIKAGRKPRYCPPEGPGSMGSEEFMTRLGSIPAGQRARIDMTEATTRILAQKFPCPR